MDDGFEVSVRHQNLSGKNCKVLPPLPVVLVIRKTFRTDVSRHAELCFIFCGVRA